MEPGYTIVVGGRVVPVLDMGCCFAEVDWVVVEAGANSSVVLANHTRQAQATGILDILDFEAAAVGIDIGLDHRPAAVQERRRVGLGLRRRVSKLKACRMVESSECRVGWLLLQEEKTGTKKARDDVMGRKESWRTYLWRTLLLLATGAAWVSLVLRCLTGLSAH